MTREDPQQRQPVAESRPDQPDAGPPASHPMEIWISYALRLGVSLAGIVIAIGILVFGVLGPRTGEHISIHDYLHGQHPIALSPAGVFRGIGNGEPLAVVYLGLFLLILTPVLRVAMTVFLFGAQREWVFTLITAIVLGVLILGVVGLTG